MTEKVGEGRSGFVHGVTVNASSDADQMSVPPLVIKLSLQNQRADLSREAWFYEELLDLQGSVIPCCYGYFEADLPAEPSFREAMHENRHLYLDREEEVQEPFKPNRIGILLLERLGESLPPGELAQETRFIFRSCALGHVLIQSISQGDHQVIIP